MLYMVVTEFMDFTWSYTRDSLQNVKSLTIFEDFVVQGEGLEVSIRPQGQGLSSITTTLFACPWSFAYGRLILSFVIIIIILLLLIILRSFLLKPRNSCLELPSWHRCFIGHCYRLQTQVFKLLVGLMLSLLTRLCNLGTSIRAGLLPWCPGQHIFRYTIFANISLAVFHLLSVYVCFYLCSQINLIWFEYGHVVRWMECFFF